jgi:flagellin
MSAVINTNLASLFAQNSLNNAQNNLATSVQRLSSGLRINSAKDDASGLSISQTMAGHIASLNQAALNAQQATNLAQTADTSLSTVQDILLRMQQLSVEGANGSLSNSQRGAIVTEMSNLNTQINSFANGTTYNGIQLLGASSATGSIGLDATSGTKIAVAGTGSVTIGNLSTGSAAIANYTLSTGASGTVTLTGNNLSQTVTLTALTGANATETVSFSNLGVSFSVTSSTGTASASDLANALAGQATLTVSAGTPGALSFQVGASPTASGDSISVSTYNIKTAGGSLSSLNQLGTQITGALTSDSANTSITAGQWLTDFQTLNTYVQSAISDISSQRATLGSVMNQLSYINTNLESQSANEQAARSTIVDTNYSAETASLTKGQIMQQAATAMLAQANQMPNVILSLLK